MTDRQLGKFHLSFDWLRRDPEQVAAILALMKCVPVRAEMVPWMHRVEYVALSPLFAVVSEGAMVPEYRMIIREEKGWPVEVKAERVP